MSIKYEFVIDAQFPNRKVASDRLELEIQQSSISSALDYIATDNVHCDIYFKSSLSDSDIATLNGLIAVHAGEPIPAEPVLVTSADPRDNNGVPKTSSYFPALGMRPCFRGFQFDANVGQTTFYDIEIWDYIRIWSGVAWISNLCAGDWNDYLEFSIIDKNDVLGLFSMYGLTVGQNILELKKFVVKEYIRKFADSNNSEIDMSVPALMGDPLYPGLFMRVAYTCDPSDHVNQTGQEPPHIVVRFQYFSR